MPLAQPAANTAHTWHSFFQHLCQEPRPEMKVRSSLINFAYSEEHIEKALYMWHSTWLNQILRVAQPHWALETLNSWVSFLQTVWTQLSSQTHACSHCSSFFCVCNTDWWILFSREYLQLYCNVSVPLPWMGCESMENRPRAWLPSKAGSELLQA